MIQTQLGGDKNLETAELGAKETCVTLDWRALQARCQDVFMLDYVMLCYVRLDYIMLF